MLANSHTRLLRLQKVSMPIASSAVHSVRQLTAYVALPGPLRHNRTGAGHVAVELHTPSLSVQSRPFNTTWCLPPLVARAFTGHKEDSHPIPLVCETRHPTTHRLCCLWKCSTRVCKQLFTYAARFLFLLLIALRQRAHAPSLPRTLDNLQIL